jgi:hypothetical protein
MNWDIFTRPLPKAHLFLTLPVKDLTRIGSDKPVTGSGTNLSLNVFRIMGARLNEPIDKEKYKNQKYWRQPYLRLQSLIQSAFNTYPGSFYEYDLAFYYATLLTDPATKAFVEGALNNELTEWSPDKWAYVPMKPDSIEPTAISLLPSTYGDLLLDISDLLQDKVDEEEFWKVDGKFLDNLGMTLTRLNDMKAMARLRGMMKG